QDLSITRKEAAEYIDRYFETYPGVKAYLDGEVAFAKEHGYVTTIFGRRRPVPELSSSNFMQRSFGERVALNSPIQGAAADIMKSGSGAVVQQLDGEMFWRTCGNECRGSGGSGRHHEDCDDPCQSAAS